MNKTNNTDGLKHTTRTAIAISDAAMSAGGDYRATVRALARFCTDALVDIAEQTYVPAKFSSEFPKYRRATRDEALFHICGWVSYQKLEQWRQGFERSAAAARTAFPAAIEQLGAVL